MGKRRNEDPNGGVWHVYARGNDRGLIFRDDTDRHVYLRMLGQVVKRAGWSCKAYCLMSNHLHLVIETQEANLGWGMQLLHGHYALAFNRRHGRAGHLFQGRYGSTAIEDDGHLCMTLRYVELNPVEAGLCDRPEDWEWSSCRAILSGANVPAFLDVEGALGSFEWLGGDSRERYAEIMEPPSAATIAMHQAPRQRYRRELVRSHPGEEPGLDLGDQGGELLPLGRRQVPAAAAPRPHELHQPTALAPVEPGQVLLREHRDLGQREELEDGKPP